MSKCLALRIRGWAELENAFAVMEAERDGPLEHMCSRSVPGLKKEVKLLRQQCLEDNMKDTRRATRLLC